MQGIVEYAIVLTCVLFLIVLFYQDRRSKNIREPKDEVEFLRTSLSIEGTFLGIIIILMAYSPEIVIVLPVFGLILVLFLRVTQINDIEKELREDCEREAASQMTKSQRGD